MIKTTILAISYGKLVLANWSDAPSTLIPSLSGKFQFLLLSYIRERPFLPIFYITVKPVHSGHLRFRKNSPLCTGVRYIYVFIL